MASRSVIVAVWWFMLVSQYPGATLRTSLSGL